MPFAYTIKVKWTANAKIMHGSPTDLLYLLVFNPHDNQWVLADGIAVRSYGVAYWALPLAWRTDYTSEVHCWICFMSASGLDVSTSQYFHISLP